MRSSTSFQNSQSNTWQKLGILCAFCIFIVALAIRFYHLGEVPVDRLPDSYHRWLIAQLTMHNGWAYTDLKPNPNNTIVWLPLFQYLIAIAACSLENGSIMIPRVINLLIGSLTCVAVYGVAIRLNRSKWYAIVGGLLLAFQPWHADFSILGGAETLSGFFVILTTYALISNKPKMFGVFSLLAALCSYEPWIVIIAELILGLVKKGWRNTGLLYAVVSLPATIVGWSAWSYYSTGDPIAWVLSTLYAMYPLGWEIHLVNPSVLLFYVNNLMVMTFFIFFIGLVFGMLKGGDTRVITVSMLAAVAVYSLAHYVGLDFGDQGRVILLLPLLATVAPTAFPKFNGSKIRRFLIVLTLLLVIVIPYFSQIWIFPKKVYIIMPEYRAGEALGQAYHGGNILSDSAVAVYASRVEVDRFMTYEKLRWFLQNENDSQLVEWLRGNDVRYLIWQETNQTLGYRIFPYLSDGQAHTLRQATFTLVYEDSLRTGYWEHSPEYRIQDVLIYRIDYS